MKQFIGKNLFTILLVISSALILSLWQTKLIRGALDSLVTSGEEQIDVAAEFFGYTTPWAKAQEAAEAAQEEAEEEEPVAAVTRFWYYPATEVHSKFYEDAGRIADSTDADYIQVDASYFDDACFIGDSRTLGLYDYSNLDTADFYCENGYCVYDWVGQKTITCQDTGEEKTLEEFLNEKQYGKVYLMIGMNDCGYYNIPTFKEHLQEMIAMIEQEQPDATIFLLANLWVSNEVAQENTQSGGVYTNLNINARNVALAECADGLKTYYLEYNYLFLGEDLGLRPEVTFDGYHLYADQYVHMVEFLEEHGLQTK